jgi:hypothetical protein
MKFVNKKNKFPIGHQITAISMLFPIRYENIHPIFASCLEHEPEVVLRKFRIQFAANP